MASDGVRRSAVAALFALAVLAGCTALRPDDQALLKGLIEEAGSLACEPPADGAGPSDATVAKPR